jgi:outer membrane protein insertion porin family
MWDGNKAIPAAELLPKLRVAPGKVFRKDEVKYSVSVIESNYRDKGYYEVSVSTTLLSAPDRQLDLRFVVDEGPIFKIGAISIEGNQKISSGIILRTLGIHSGDLFSQSKIFEGNRQLYQTGYFDGLDFIYSTMTEHTVDVAIRVRERATKYIKGGWGYGTQTKERVTLGYEDLNFLGNARKLDVTATHSGFLTNPSHYRTTLLQTSLTQPNLFGTALEGNTNVAREWDNRESYDSVSTAWLSSVGRRFSSAITASMRYRYQGTRITNVSSEAKTPGFTNISALGPTFTFDNTNDPFLPSNGWRVIGTYEEGVRFFAGDVRFHKLENRVGRFDTVFGKWTFFEGIQAGVIRPDSTSDRDIIPIYERYFLGGANTVRGYSERELGPRDSAGAPLGGDAFLVANWEMWHPLYKKLFGVVFLDGGQLYSTPAGHVWPTIRAEGLDDFRYSTGFGLRLHSPVGAIRLELGYKLNPQGGTGFFDRTAIHFSIGEVF